MPKPSRRRPKKLSRRALERRRRLIAQRKRRATEAKWAANGLVKPDASQPKPGTRAFENLRQQWYAKLAAAEQAKVDRHKTKSGKARAEASKFTDIEWAENPDSRHIKMPASRGRKLTPGKQLYYALGRNFLTHFKFKSAQEKVAWSMHIEGKSYREILEHLKAHFGLKKSVYWIYYYVQKTGKKCKKFNSEHAEGLLNPANQDSFATDALLGDFRLQTAEPADDYGMPMDSGYWESVPKPR